MSLVVYLAPGSTGNVRRGDMVFQFAEAEGDKWKPRWLVHTGISEQTVEAYQHRNPLTVIHMGAFITRETWTGGVDTHELRIDASGARNDLDDLTRDNIIDQARAYYGTDPSIFKGQNIPSCYWMGDPHPHDHPLFPDASSVYAFSCSSFAHHCYTMVGSPIVDTSAMPVITDAERIELEGLIGTHRIIQPTPFRRLYPSYLMNAFLTDDYPFSPADWEHYKAHGVFIPAELAVPGPQPEAPTDPDFDL